MMELAMGINRLAKLKLERGWEIELLIDEDSHLTIHVKNEDGSNVQELGADICDDEVWGERFTTEKIEEDYNNSVGSPRVSADFWTDGYDIEVKDFDATAYFHQASDEDIFNLIQCGYRGDMPADEVAIFASKRDTKMRVGIDEGNGFECAVDEASLIEWLKVHRPHLVPEEGE